MKEKTFCVVPAVELISADALQEQWNISAPTLWRRERQGLLTPINIYGRKYYRRAEIREFETRAVNGEFARPPRGAAAATAAKRKSKEGGK